MLGGFIIAYVPATAFRFLFLNTGIWVGILVGALVGFLGLLLWIEPRTRGILGVLIILLSMVSLMTSDFGGFFVGMLLGIIGGSMALAWTPVAGKTPRQQRWITKSGVALPRSTPVETPAQVIVLASEEETPPDIILLSEEPEETSGEVPTPVVDLDAAPPKPVIDLTSETVAETEESRVGQAAPVGGIEEPEDLPSADD